MSDQVEFDFNAPLPRMSSAQAIEKIKRLLRLGQSANPHEAALAMEKAFAMAQKHRIDVSALDLDDEQAERLAHEWFHIGKRLSFLQKRALAIVITFFNVDACVWPPRIVFVGTPSDVAIAWYVYEFLVQQGRRWLREFEAEERAARRKVFKAKGQNFVQGFIYGISTQLKKRHETIVLEDSKTALVLAEQKRGRESYMGELVPNMKTQKLTDVESRNRTALMRGFERGQQTRINRPLRDGERLALAG